LIAPDKACRTTMTVMTYSKETVAENVITTLDDIAALPREDNIVWINVCGLGNTDLIAGIGEIFSLHPLALEDVLNVHHRPKAEDYENDVFIVTRMVGLKHNRLDLEQVSIFLGNGFVISFQERPGDCLEPVRERIRKGRQRIRFMQADYLAYALLDAIIDGYFPVLEHYSDKLTSLENEVVANPDQKVVAATHEIKRDLQILRHGIWPLREALNKLSYDMPLVHDSTRPFFRDCHDHVIQIVDILETFHERAASLTDLYLSSLSNKMNEIMKVLTIIATIFIPLSFIAGLYGMNFNPAASPYNMPELSWYLGYPFALFLMLVVAVGFVLHFWRKGWIGTKNH